MPKILFRSEETEGMFGINFYDDGTYEVLQMDYEKEPNFVGNWRFRFGKIEAQDYPGSAFWSPFSPHVQAAYHCYLAKLVID